MIDNIQEVEFTINMDGDGKVESILMEEVGGVGRWLYKREPKGMELPLTDAIFEETAKVYLDNGIFEADDFYVQLRAHDEYYANLMKKVFKKYLKEYVDYSSLLRDALFGE